MKESVAHEEGSDTHYLRGIFSLVNNRKGSLNFLQATLHRCMVYGSHVTPGHCLSPRKQIMFYLSPHTQAVCHRLKEHAQGILDNGSQDSRPSLRLYHCTFSRESTNYSLCIISTSIPGFLLLFIYFDNAKEDPGPPDWTIRNNNSGL